MASNPPAALRPRITPGARVHQTGPRSWRLEIPADTGTQNRRRSTRYHLAQLDDYQQLPRSSFLWRQPVDLSLRARASHPHIPGTWGFGLWNDPFGVAFVKGGGLHLPVLPNAAWFFFASPENYLSLRDDLPANGALAATFSSPRRLPLRAIGLAPLLPLISFPPIACWFRRQAQRFINQDSVHLNVDTTQWHQYRLSWGKDYVTFSLDGEVLLQTSVVPHGPLGLVLWIDNQYAVVSLERGFGFGVLATSEPQWLELRDLRLEAL